LVTKDNDDGDGPERQKLTKLSLSQYLREVLKIQERVLAYIPLHEIKETKFYYGEEQIAKYEMTFSISDIKLDFFSRRQRRRRVHTHTSVSVIYEMQFIRRIEKP